MRKLIIGTVVPFLLFISGCGGQQPVDQTAEQEKVKIVDIMTIKEQKDQIATSFVGIVEPNQSALLSFNSSGKINNFSVENGDLVQKGQVLAALDTELSASESSLAQQQIVEANASKSKLLQGATKESIEQQKLKIESAKQNLEKAEKDLNIGEQLLASGAISKNEVDQLRNEANHSANMLKTEQYTLDTLSKGPDQDQLARANLSIAQAQKEATRISQDLDNKVLKAPFTGIVMDVKQLEGDVTVPGSPVIELVDLSKIKVNVQVRDDLISQFGINNKVSITTESQRNMTGTITYISPIIDPATGKYRVEIMANLEKMEWKDGMVVNVNVPKKLTTGIVIPLQSVGIHEDGNYVLLVEKGKVKKQNVELGQTMEGNVEIVNGLEAGAKLIISGISYLLEDEKVEMKEVPSGQNH